jgi:hypothetical protein
VHSPINLYPGPSGTLELLAQDNIDLSQALVRVPDMLPADLPGVLRPDSVVNTSERLGSVNNWSSPQAHSSLALHQDDREPARIVAATGDIIGTGSTGETLQLAKPAIVKAGRDIKDLYYVGQNLRPEDVTRIEAGRDIFFTTPGVGANVSVEQCPDRGRRSRPPRSAGRSRRGPRQLRRYPHPWQSRQSLPSRRRRRHSGAGGSRRQCGSRGFIDRYLADTDSAYRVELLATCV